MKIELKRMPQPPDGVAVGTLDGEPLVYRGRTPFVGERQITHAEIARPLLEAVDEVASGLFGHEWISGMNIVTGIHVRTLARDRILRFGLPAPLLRFLGEASDVEPAQLSSMGDLLLAVGRLNKKREDANKRIGMALPPLSYEERRGIAFEVQGMLVYALEILDKLLRDKALHQAPKTKF